MPSGDFDCGPQAPPEYYDDIDDIEIKTDVEYLQLLRLRNANERNAASAHREAARISYEMGRMEADCTISAELLALRERRDV